MAAETIVVTFSLVGQERGMWDLSVKNRDSESTTFYNGFEIESGSKLLWVDLVGPSEMRENRSTQFTVRYGNRGNVDAEQPLILFGRPH
jgi:hypothetical protein